MSLAIKQKKVLIIDCDTRKAMASALGRIAAGRSDPLPHG